jgi:hypothetical protein
MSVRPAFTHELTRADASKLLQAAEYQHGYSSRPALAEGPSSKVIDRGMMGKGMTDMTLVLFPCQTFLCLFSLVSGRSQILHFVAVRVKLDASALTNFPFDSIRHWRIVAQWNLWKRRLSREVKQLKQLVKQLNT